MVERGADAASASTPAPNAIDELRFEPLAKQHDRKAFSCGVDALDRYLKTQATQDAKRYAAATVVAVLSDSPTIFGYYTLAPTGVDVSEFPGEATRKLPRYPVVPAILLGRLAVDHRFRRQGCGEALLMDAIARALRHADQIGGAAMIVDAKDEKAARFYEGYDFKRFPDRSDRLFLQMTVIRKLFG